MPIVQMPDGTKVNFPDEMPKEQIRSLIQSKFPDIATQPERTGLQEAGRQTLRAGRAIASGAAGLGDIVNMPIDAALRAAGVDFQFGSPSGFVKESFDQPTAGTAYSTAPENLTEKISDTAIGSLAPAGAITKAAQGGKLAVNTVGDLLSLLGASAGSEAATEVFPDSTTAQIGGALLGGVAPSATLKAGGSGMAAVKNTMNKAIFGDIPTNIKPSQAGVNLTLGQSAPTQKLQKLENSLRVKAETSDKFFNKSVEQFKQAKNTFSNIIDKIGGKSLDDARVGDSVKKVFDKSVDNAVKARDSQAGLDFGIVSKLSNNERIFPANNFKNTLKGLIAKGSERGATPSDIKEANIAKKLLGDFTKTRKGFDVTSSYTKDIVSDLPLTPTEFQNQLKRFGKLSAGKGTVFADMKTADSVRFAKRLFGSLQDDISETIAKSGEGTPVASALKKARDNYRIHSQSINELEDTVLNKIIGTNSKQPEDIAKALVRLKPSGISQSLDIIKKTSPDLTSDVQRYFVENAFNKGVTTSRDLANKYASKAGFNPREFIKALPDDDKLAAIFKGSKGAEIRKQLKDGADAIEKILQNLSDGSPTQPLQEIQATVKDTLSLKLGGLIERKLLNNKYNEIADIMLDPKNAQKLRNVASSKDRALAEKSARALLPVFLSTNE